MLFLVFFRMPNVMKSVYHWLTKIYYIILFTVLFYGRIDIIKNFICEKLLHNSLADKTDYKFPKNNMGLYIQVKGNM